MQPLAQIAYYYPEPIWEDGNWAKNLLLYFDGISILVPEYMTDRILSHDEAVTSGLINAGLLHILRPEKIVEKDVAKHLVQRIENLLYSGALDNLQPGEFHRISYSRAGFKNFDAAAAIELLQEKGLALQSDDGVSIPMHPTVRTAYLVFLSEIISESVETTGMALYPTTDIIDLHTSKAALLDSPAFPSMGHVVMSDLYQIGLDLGSVPIDEILDFKKSHGKEFQHYSQGLREHVTSLAAMDRNQRLLASDSRDEELKQQLSEIRRVAKKNGFKLASFALSVISAVASAASGNPFPAAASATGALSSLIGGLSGASKARSSYLLAARDQFA